MLIFKFFVFSGILCLISSNESNEKIKNISFDFNLFKTRLDKHAKHVGIRGYLELPDPDLFINLDSIKQRPSKFINYSVHSNYSLSELFNKWNEKDLTTNLMTNFAFGNLNEFKKKKTIKKKINLKYFLNNLKKYTHETSFELKMPLFFRETIEFPSLLECDYLENKFKTIKMEIHLNYEKFTPTKLNELDQLICPVKTTNLTIILMNTTNVEKILSQSNLTKKFLKTIEYQKTNIDEGHCFYVPKNWFYAFNSKFSWHYSIFWKPVAKAVTEEECFDRNNKKNATKISEHKFSLDKNESLDYLRKKFGLINYFAIYINSTYEKSINQKNFINILKEDKVIMKTIEMCDDKCLNVAKRIFAKLDTNKDKSFNLDDLENLDEDSLIKINQNILTQLEILTEDLEQKPKINNLDSLKLMEELQKAAKDPKVESQLNELIKEKSKELFKILPDDLKESLKNIDLNKVLETLAKINDNKNSKPTKKQKQKLIEKDEEFQIINENEADEIVAEENNIGDKKSEL